MLVTGEPKNQEFIELREYVISQLAKDYNILVSKDDPILVAAIINKLCLDYAARNAIQNLENLADRIESSHVEAIQTSEQLAENLITHSAQYIENEVKEIFTSQVSMLQKEVAKLDIEIKNTVLPVLKNGQKSQDQVIQSLKYMCYLLSALVFLCVILFIFK